MLNLPMPLPSPECSDCQYHQLGKFDNSSSAAIEDFYTLGRLFCLPKGISLIPQNKPGERVFVVCKGHLKFCSVSEGSADLNLDAEAGDRSIAGSPSRVDKAAMRAETLGPTTINMIPRAEFTAFLKSNNAADVDIAASFSDLQICFLGCSRDGAVRLCSWSSAAHLEERYRVVRGAPQMEEQR